MATTTTQISLTDSRIHARTAYGTIAGSLRDYLVSPSAQAYRALVNACDCAEQALDLVRQAKAAIGRVERNMSSSDREADRLATIDSMLGL